MPEIRELREDDLAGLLGLYRHLHATDDPPPPESEVTRVWSQLVADPWRIYIGAFVGGQLTSVCNASVILNLTRGARPYAVVENVVTHPDHRRHGLARATMRALIDECWKHNCYKIMLMSSAARSGGHGLYEGLGFDAHAKRAFVMKR